MTFAFASHFHIYLYHGLPFLVSECTFNQEMRDERAPVGAFSIIVKLQSSRGFVCSSTSERMRVTRTEEGDLSVIMETPGRGPE